MTQCLRELTNDQLDALYFQTLHSTIHNPTQDEPLSMQDIANEMVKRGLMSRA